MKFWIDKDGNRECVQAVKRGEKIYYRRCAETMYNPTDAQLRVRTTLMKASHDSALENANRDELLNNVKQAFPISKPYTKPKSDLERYIKEKYSMYLPYIEAEMNGKE